MKRQVNINEITDGRLYGPNDMVKVGCEDCAGCSSCCRDMGDSLVLDPMDIYRLTVGLKLDFTTLMKGYIELHVVDGLILPNISMKGNGCSFLNPEGRCAIHPVRPGICRLFPLGRLYKEEGRGFDYVLQTQECKKENRTKLKVKKWMDTENLSQYDKFIVDWHYFLEDVQNSLQDIEDEAARKNACMQILTLFYATPYDGNKGEAGFYEQFYARLAQLIGGR